MNTKDFIHAIGMLLGTLCVVLLLTALVLCVTGDNGPALAALIAAAVFGVGSLAAMKEGDCYGR